MEGVAVRHGSGDVRFVGVNDVEGVGGVEFEELDGDDFHHLLLLQRSNWLLLLLIVGLVMPRSLTAAAVPYKPPNDDTRVDAPTVDIFSFMSFFLPYIDIESAITAGPSRNSKTSPAPAMNGVSIPVLYDLSTVKKVDPVSITSNLAESHVTLVHVMRGWTNLVTLLGRLAPNTKPESVVNRRNDD